MFGFIKNLFLPKVAPKGKKILVVDDIEVNRLIPKKIFEKAGYEVEVAENGVNSIIQAQKFKPDLIILDCEMPDLQGTEVCDLLKSYSKTSQIPIIFLSSLDTPGHMVDCFDKGGEVYLTKPINAKELLSQVKTTFEDLESASD